MRSGQSSDLTLVQPDAALSLPPLFWAADGQRSLVGTTIGRYKAIIGPGFSAPRT